MAPMLGGMRSLRELGDLSGRRALVCGGAGRIGEAIGEALVEQGAQVCVSDVDGDAASARATALDTLGPGRATSIQCDLADEDATRALVRRAADALGGLDVLVHAAALVGTTTLDGWAVPFEEQSVGAWDAALRVNLTSAFVVTQEARRALSSSGRGSVILIGSMYGVVGPDQSLYEGTTMVNPAGYGASKGGLLQLMRTLATTLAPDVRVNAISPGGVERGQPDVFQERYRTRTPLGRLAREEDIKGAVAFLASDLSAYVTGHNLVVDGGWTAW
jgi:NAD(P)-dependent dehydrogenase (short-subunit alcohol dehydrogenase family)